MCSRRYREKVEQPGFDEQDPNGPEDEPDQEDDKGIDSPRPFAAVIQTGVSLGWENGAFAVSLNRRTRSRSFRCEPS